MEASATDSFSLFMQHWSDVFTLDAFRLKPVVFFETRDTLKEWNDRKDCSEMKYNYLSIRTI